jgi:hypothetical protein
LIVLTDLSSIKDSLSSLIDGKKAFNEDVFINPDKYAVCLPIQKIIADSKVSKKGVEFYKQKIQKNEKIPPIIVVKHPELDLYAVLDGHHRFYAYLELGKKKVDCALAGEYSKVIFYLTEHGYLQPSVKVTEAIRQPAIRMHKNLKLFLDNFLKEKPEKSAT